MRRSLLSAALLAMVGLAIALVGCGGGDDAEPGADNAAVVSTAQDEAALREAAIAHLLANGAQRAAADDVNGYWKAGDIYLPAGGPSCRVAEIYTGRSAEIAANAQKDASGAVALTEQSTFADHPKCFSALGAAIDGFAP
jgi:hypothetical protein